MKMLLNRMRWIGSRIMTAAMSSGVWSVVTILEDDGEPGPPNTGGQPVTLVNETGQPVTLITRT